MTNNFIACKNPLSKCNKGDKKEVVGLMKILKGDASINIHKEMINLFDGKKVGR
jgi:hypothetical protein